MRAIRWTEVWSAFLSIGLAAFATPAPAQNLDSSEVGAALALPVLTSFDEGSAADTSIVITNTSSQAIRLGVQVISGDPDDRWVANSFDCVMTGRETTAFHFSSNGSGGSRVDFECSEPDADADSPPSSLNIRRSEVLGAETGIMLVYVQTLGGQTSSNNVLVGAATLIDYAAGTAAQVGAIAFQGGDSLAQDGNLQLRFDGLEYAQFPSVLTSNFYAESADHSSYLVLFTLDGTISSTPPRARVKIDYYNDDERHRDAAHEFDCFDIVRLRDLAPGFLLENLGSTTGHLRLTPGPVSYPNMAHDLQFDGPSPDGVRTPPVHGWLVSVREIEITVAGSFSALGELPGGGVYSAAFGVSGDGSVVVGESESGSGFEAFRWEAGTMTGLGDLAGGGVYSSAFGISADGSVIVGESESGSGFEAFRWETGTMTGLGDLADGDFGSRASDASGDGSVVVGQGTSGSGFEAFRWETGTMTGLGDLPGGSFSSDANAVSDDGSVVVGGSNSGSGNEAFRWEAGTMTGLGDLPGGSFFSNADGISGDGSVIVGRGSSDSGTEAFRWEAGVMTGLGDLPGGTFSSRAFDASGDGSVVVGRGNTDAGNEAFIWDATNGMRSIQQLLAESGVAEVAGWQLVSANGVSTDGLKVVGVGTNPEGDTEGWLVDFTPTTRPAFMSWGETLSQGVFSLAPTPGDTPVFNAGDTPAFDEE